MTKRRGTHTSRYAFTVSASPRQTRSSPRGFSLSPQARPRCFRSDAHHLSIIDPAYMVAAPTLQRKDRGNALGIILNGLVSVFSRSGAYWLCGMSGFQGSTGLSVMVKTQMGQHCMRDGVTHPPREQNAMAERLTILIDAPVLLPHLQLQQSEYPRFFRYRYQSVTNSAHKRSTYPVSRNGNRSSPLVSPPSNTRTGVFGVPECSGAAKRLLEAVR
ncbi:hypothetical protein FIBSPDRAFT_20393 [Athelia psychrophila]|uniref:Uncharacterized protein n=1 Tax=Athelia psychrophila TaxID=1759441 RepID=A0A166UDC6_9AGAM|nr:hypothetical protein FIBSPDRAFT_20393 [Fibularhizoctonia sp. CBS 109695]